MQASLTRRGCAATVNFESNLTWEAYAPDVNIREQILISGQFLGPLFDLDQGDDLYAVTISSPPQRRSFPRNRAACTQGVRRRTRSK